MPARKNQPAQKKNLSSRKKTPKGAAITKKVFAQDCDDETV